MYKARTSTSKEVANLKQFNVNIVKPTEIYILGLFESKQSQMYEIYSDFASQYGEDVRLYHSFKTDELLKSLGSPENVKSPAVLVFYHDLAVVKNEPKFKAFISVKIDDFFNYGYFLFNFFFVHYKKENPSYEALEKFVFRESLPLVSHMSQLTQKLVYNTIKPICYLIYDVDIELRPCKTITLK